jgi:hypothetical protein
MSSLSANRKIDFVSRKPHKINYIRSKTIFTSSAYQF